MSPIEHTRLPVLPVSAARRCVPTRVKIAHLARANGFANYLTVNPTKSCRVDGAFGKYCAYRWSYSWGTTCRPPALKNGQIEFLVPKDAQYSETYAITILRFFFFVHQNFHLHDFLTKNVNEKFSFTLISFKLGSA